MINNDLMIKQKIKQLALAWTLVLAWMILIFFLSSLPNLKSGLENIYDLILRKFAHIFEYLILFLLVQRALRISFLKKKTAISTSFNYRLILIATIISLIYAVSDEWHQSFVPGRLMALRDWLFDATGVLVGIILGGIKHHKKKNNGIQASQKLDEKRRID